MPKYLEKDTMDHLTMDGVKLVEIRNRLFNQYGIDLLDTDVLTKLELNKVTSSGCKVFIDNKKITNGQQSK